MKPIQTATIALALTLGSAWADNHLPDSVEAEVMLKTTTSWDGAELPSYPQGQPEVTIVKITVPKGVQLPMHQHPVINAGIVLKGEITVTKKSGEKIILKAGDAIAEVVEQWHFGANTGDDPAEIIVFYAGVKNEPITVK
ncbi:MULTISPECIES: cupin domain-containing protein [unclassified Vibrio]|uniref:cupin domain-containing protein n=1 Tax=Vibrio TaxID=662 RepID=UPI002553EF67|nr:MULTISPECIES: cupin domain-containing protein [unclassified Vibrio]MDK9779064.1 cupin domain-containing protein [Vibrio sp. D401a]MDK9807081.1 cupin domain-containing protein [Vibrio sp. D406a]